MFTMNRRTRDCGQCFTIAPYLSDNPVARAIKDSAGLFRNMEGDTKADSTRQDSATCKALGYVAEHAPL